MAIFRHSLEAECIQTSVIHVIHLVHYVEAACDLFLRGPLPLMSLATLSRWLEYNVGLYRLRSPPFGDEPRAWLLEQVEGVLIIRLTGFRGVCSNCRSLRMYGRFSTTGLPFNGFELDKISEIRSVELQQQRPDSNKKRRNNPEKRKRKRHENLQRTVSILLPLDKRLKVPSSILLYLLRFSSFFYLTPLHCVDPPLRIDTGVLSCHIRDVLDAGRTCEGIWDG